MRSLTIHAANAASARAIASALCEYRVKLIEANGYHEVVVAFGDGDQEIVRVLSALARYATYRADSPAGVEASRV